MYTQPTAPNQSDARWHSDFNTISFVFQGKPDGWCRGYWQKYALTDDSIQVSRSWYDDRGFPCHAATGFYLSDIKDLRIDGKLIKTKEKK